MTIKGLFERLKKNEFWGSVVTLSLGQIIAQGITMLATLLLSRIYDNADYGLFGVITSSAAIIISFISLGVGSAIMVVDTEEDAFRLLRTIYIVELVLILAVTCGLAVISPFYRVFELPIPYYAGLIIMALYIATNVLSTLMRVLVNRMKKNNVLFFNSLINAGCTVFISIPLGLLHFGFIGLISASILACAISALQMLRAGNPFKKRFRFKDIAWMFKTCKQYVLYQYPSNLMGTVSANIPNQTLYNMFGEESLGSYSMCNRLFQLPMNLIISPIQTVYFRTASQMKERLNELADFTFGFIKKLLLLAILPALILMGFGEPMFAFVLGETWGEAGIIAAYMSLYFVFFFLNSCTAYLRVAIGKTKQNLIMTIAQIAAIVMALLSVILLKANLMQTILIFSVTNTLFNIADIFVSFICLKKNAFKFLAWSAVFCLILIASTTLIRTVL